MRDSAEILIYEYLYLKVKQTFLKYLAWTLGFCDALRCLYVASGSAVGSASVCVCVCVFTTISQICICVCVRAFTYFGHRQICKYGPNMLPYCTWLRIVQLLEFPLKCCHEMCRALEVCLDTNLCLQVPHCMGGTSIESSLHSHDLIWLEIWIYFYILNSWFRLKS